MNKAKIDRLLPLAYQAITDTGIREKDGSVQKTFRGQVSTFGASVSMGSLLAAIAFFSDKGGADVDRRKILDAIFHVLSSDAAIPGGNESLYSWAKKEVAAGREAACKDDIIHAAIAVKLAMNLFPLRDNKEKAR